MQQQTITAELAGRYEINREIGRGGSAVVYLAHDIRHDRSVAVKVLLQEMAHSVSRERFVREIAFVAKLNHPHILPLLDSGEVADSFFYVMPYVEGDTLRKRLTGSRMLPLEEALGIAREVAGGLAYAHARGVVHRDIKPENILLSNGVAVVADFGIARALSQSTAGGITRGGGAIGTPEYMSPEQASGSSDVNGSADQYALACIVYEMLAGHPPFTGTTFQEILARHTLDPVPSLAASRPDIPREVERVLGRALAKSRADRFETVADFGSALEAAAKGTAVGMRAPMGSVRRRTIAIAVSAGLVLLLAALAGWWSTRVKVLGEARDPSIAVLPFSNLTGDTHSEYFSDGMTEELINALTQIRNLHVAARTGAFQFKGTSTPIREIARTLHVTWLLEGSVRRSGQRMRVTARLVNAANGYELWSHTYDREVRDAIALQDEIAQTITSALRIRLSGDEVARLASAKRIDEIAYDYYLQARYYWNRGTREDVLKSIAYYDSAIARDSSYPLAYSGLADAYGSAILSIYLPTDIAMPRGRAAAAKAIALDPNLAEAHSALARLDRHSWNWKAAEQGYRRSIEINPHYALAHSGYGSLLSDIGRYTEAIAQHDTAVRLDPLQNRLHTAFAGTLLSARQYSRAVDESRRCIALQPMIEVCHRQLSDALASLGMLDSAVAHQKVAMALAPATKKHRHLARLASAYARMGRPEMAKEVLREIDVKYHPTTDLLPLAMAHIAVGDTAHGLTLLETAVNNHDLPNPQALGLADWDPVRKSKRFAAALDKAGLGVLVDVGNGPEEYLRRRR